MLPSSIICDVISFFATRKQAYLLNNLRNFNDIFRKDVADDNVKSDKKLGFSPPSLEATFLKKPQQEGKIDPPQPF